MVAVFGSRLGTERTLTTGVSRRAIVGTFIGCCCVCAAPPASSQLPSIFIPTGSQGLIACGSEPGIGGEFQPISSRILGSSGISAIDAGFPVERRTLDYIFGFSGSDETKDFGRPSFSFYDDSDQRIGARALRGGPKGCSVYFGLKLISDEVVNQSGHWGTAFAGLLAHEWAHAFQYRSQLDERRFLWETHADYLAGWYIGVKKVYGAPVEPELFSAALFRRGSKLGYFNENDYGSPQQRADAMMEGLQFGLANSRPDRRPSVSSAAEAGYEVVSRMRQSSRVR